MRINIAALSPGMLRLAGEIGDGVMLWLCNPNYIHDVVVPEVTTGRERAGKTLEGFDVVAAVPAALTDDPAPAYEAMRRDLLPYFGLPFYRAMLERSGFDADIAAYDAAVGDVHKMQTAISTDFLEVLTAAAQDARRSVQILEKRTQSKDHPILLGVPETHYLKCIICCVL